MLRNIVQLSLIYNTKIIKNSKILKTINPKPAIKYRYSTGWSSRKPSAIVNEKEFFDKTENITNEVKYKMAYKTRKHRSKESEKKKDNKNNEEVIMKPYIPLDADNKIISSLMLKIKTKKLREKNNMILLEGFRLIKDAIDAKLMPKIVFFNRLSDILPLSLPTRVKLYKIPYRTIQLWSNLTTSPGILGIFDIPNIKDKDLAANAIPLTIICDNIREPGNLGTIIRAAAAVGCERLLLMKGCVDLWDPKVLRSAVGAHFRLPISTNLSWDEIPTLINEESNIFLADNNITYENEFENYTANKEANNPIRSEDLIGFEDKNFCEVNFNNNVDYDSKNKEIDKLLNETKLNKSSAETKLLVKQVISQFPIVSYYTLDFTQRETVLIIGGETEGVNIESCKLLHERNCVRINIPLTNGVDSLNVGIAIGIITYEMKRQFMIRNIKNE